MEKRIEIRERAPVVSKGGENLGEVSRFVLETDRRRVTHVVTERKKLLRSEERLVPFDLIEEATPTVISLREGVADGDVPKLDAGLEAAADMAPPAPSVVVSAGDHVRSVDGKSLGTLKNIATDDAGRITDITVEPELGAAPEAVAADKVESVEDGVVLGFTREAFFDRLHVPD